MNTTKISLAQSSTYGDAVMITTYGDDSIVAGDSFVLAKNFTIAASGTLLILFDYTGYIPTPDKSGRIYVFPPKFSCTVGYCDVKVYRGTNYSGGTKVSAYNPNIFGRKKECQTIITSGPSGVDKGTESLNFIVGSKAHGNVSGGGVNQDIAFYIRDNKTKTLVEIVNQSGEEIIFNYSQVIYEI